MRYHPVTDNDRSQIFDTLGISSFEELIKGIPEKLKNPKVNLAEGVSEPEVQKLIIDRGGENQTIKKFLSFLGAGSYDHFIPSAVLDIISRHEFLTAYTPYQAEASQGTLQSIFEYQSLIVELTGLDVSNASHYDGATATAEAALVALRHTGRKKIKVLRSVHPHYRQVLDTYLLGTPFSADEVGFLASGLTDFESVLSEVDSETAAVIIQNPNFFGGVEDLTGLSEALHAKGILLIMVCHPLALGLVRMPGEWGADMAVGEGQPLGIPTAFGGPYLGYFAATKALMRKIPGRLAGITEDAEKRRVFALTLQAREQHIRREKASSNICTNQALCALAACVYMTLMGPKGMKEVAELNVDRTYALREHISKIKGFRVDLETPIFNEFRVKVEAPMENFFQLMKEKKIFPGIRLGEFYPELENELLVCVTETKSPDDLLRFAEVLKSCH